MKNALLRHVPAWSQRMASLALTAAILLPTPPCRAGDISGRIDAGENNSLVVSLTIPAPPPTSVIITCQMPPGTDVIDATPVPQKKAQKQGIVKWLAKTPNDGGLSISFTPSPTLSSTDVSCEVSYNDPHSGKMKTITIN